MKKGKIMTVESLGGARVRVPSRRSSMTTLAAVTQHVLGLARLDSQTLAELLSTAGARTLTGGFEVIDDVPDSELLMRFDEVPEARRRPLTESEYQSFLNGDVDAPAAMAEPQAVQNAQLLLRD